MHQQGNYDKALIRDCIGGLIVYASQHAQADPDSPKISEVRGHIESLASYWVLDDLSDEVLDRKFLTPFDVITGVAKNSAELKLNLQQRGIDVMSGLYLHCEDLVVSQGVDAKEELLSIVNLVREIASEWDIVGEVESRLLESGHTLGDVIADTQPWEPENDGHEIELEPMMGGIH